MLNCLPGTKLKREGRGEGEKHKRKIGRKTISLSPQSPLPFPFFPLRFQSTPATQQQLTPGQFLTVFFSLNEKVVFIKSAWATVHS